MDGTSRTESLIRLGIWALFGLALLTRSWLLLTLAFLVGGTAIVAQLWGRYALARLEYQRFFSPPRCFVGEEVELTVSLTNRKVLPVTYLQVDDTVPEELTVAARKLQHVRLDRSVLRMLFSMAWYQKVIRHYRVTPKRRGYFRVGPATLRGGDPFGFVVREALADDRSALIVYPRIVPLDRLGIATRRPFGDLRSNDRLFEDPMRFAGVRDYQPGDPLNRIHWKASAVSGRLQVRLLDPSSNMGLAVFLNTWSYDLAWKGTDPEAFEAGCVLAASIADWSHRQGLSLGLYANGLVTDWGMNLRLPPSLGSEVLTRCLEGLARLETVSNSSLLDLMAEEVPRLGYGTSVVVITRVVTMDLAGALLSVQRSGRPVSLVVTDPEVPTLPPLPGVRVYLVPGEEAVHAAVLA